MSWCDSHGKTFTAQADPSTPDTVGGFTYSYDFDNDGHKDLFTANSHVSENIGAYSHHRYRQPNALFRGVGGGRFWAEADDFLRAAFIEVDGAVIELMQYGDPDETGWF